jgi:hypothetical protein
MAATTRSKKPATSASRAGRRLTALRKFRKQLLKLARPEVPKRIASDIQRLDRRRARLQKLMAAKKLARRAGKRELALLAKMRPELTRALSTAKVVPKRALAAVDGDIKAEQKGRR